MPICTRLWTSCFSVDRNVVSFEIGISENWTTYSWSATQKIYAGTIFNQDGNIFIFWPGYLIRLVESCEFGFRFFISTSKNLRVPIPFKIQILNFLIKILEFDSNFPNLTKGLWSVTQKTCENQFLSKSLHWFPRQLFDISKFIQVSFFYFAFTLFSQRIITQATLGLGLLYS